MAVVRAVWAAAASPAAAAAAAAAVAVSRSALPSPARSAAVAAPKPIQPFGCFTDRPELVGNLAAPGPQPSRRGPVLVFGRHQALDDRPPRRAPYLPRRQSGGARRRRH